MAGRPVGACHVLWCWSWVFLKTDVVCVVTHNRTASNIDKLERKNADKYRPMESKVKN